MNPKTHRPFIAQNERYRKYEKEASKFLPKLEEPICSPVNVKCVFYRDSKRRVDLTNLLECIDDVMVKFGVLEDDTYTIVHSHDGSYVDVDKENPRTEVTIEER